MKLKLLNIVLISLTFAGCGSTGLNQAPVVERSINTAIKPNSNAANATAAVAKTAPAVATSNPVAKPSANTVPQTAPQSVSAAEQSQAGNSAYKTYTVKRGDTLYSIALENGLSYRDIATWNNITNPNYIQAEQMLRMSAIESNQLVAVSQPVQTVPAPSTAVSSTPVAAVPAAQPPTAPSPSPTSAVSTSADVVWAWPTKGKIIEQYIDGKSKGIAIAGTSGQPIYAAADGKIIHAGTALKGYGQLLIIKHNDVFISAYAHNSKLLVKEEQTVKRGQPIADMGNTDSDAGKVKLHFEIRRNGKPQDPTKLLPAN